MTPTKKPDATTKTEKRRFDMAWLVRMFLFFFQENGVFSGYYEPFLFMGVLVDHL